MPRNSVTHQPFAPALQDPCYPDDLLPELQATLAALADVTVRYESARDHLRTWTGPDAIRQHLLAQLDERCRHEHESHAQQLADLHDRMLKTTALPDICSVV